MNLKRSQRMISRKERRLLGWKLWNNRICRSISDFSSRPRITRLTSFWAKQTSSWKTWEPKYWCKKDKTRMKMMISKWKLKERTIWSKPSLTQTRFISILPIQLSRKSRSNHQCSREVSLRTIKSLDSSGSFPSTTIISMAFLLTKWGWEKLFSPYPSWPTLLSSRRTMDPSLL